MSTPPQRRRGGILLGLTPLLCGYWLRPVLDDGDRQDDESIVKGVPGANSAIYHCLGCCSVICVCLSDY